MATRWKNTSTELRCVQSLLEEVLAYWKRWNTDYEPLRAYVDEAAAMLDGNNATQDEEDEFFADMAAWKDKYMRLQDTVAFLVATSDSAVGQDLRDKVIHASCICY